MIEEAVLAKINSAIRCAQVEIAKYEELGMRIRALEEFEDLNLLVKLRETYKAAVDRGLI